MKIARGDVVLVDFPFTGGGNSKVRPAVVVQCDQDNQRLTNTIVAMVTSRISRADEPTQLLVRSNTDEGRQMGLLMDSAVNCSNVFTIERRKILRLLGTIPSSRLPDLERCLRTALAI